MKIMKSVIKIGGVTYTVPGEVVVSPPDQDGPYWMITFVDEGFRVVATGNVSITYDEQDTL